MEENSQFIEQHLFAQISEGDENAFRTIFNTYNRKLFPFILSLVKSESDARDIIQELFLKLWLSRNKLREVDNPGGWLHIVASNATYDYLRKQARHEVLMNKAGAIQCDEQDEFWQKFNSKEVRELINEAVRKLPLRRRQIFQMSKMEGFSRREIAEELNISENTVRNQLVDAIESVQEYLRINGIILIQLSALLLIIK